MSPIVPIDRINWVLTKIRIIEIMLNAIDAIVFAFLLKFIFINKSNRAGNDLKSQFCDTGLHAVKLPAKYIIYRALTHTGAEHPGSAQN